MANYHCMKSVRIWNYSDPYFPVFALDTEEYGHTDTEYGHFIHSLQSVR